MFKFTKNSIKGLRNEGLPEKIIKELKLLKYYEFFTENEFLEAVEKHIGKKQIFRYKTLILKHAIEKPVGRRYSLTRFSMYNSLEEFITTQRFKGKVLLISEDNEHSIQNMFQEGSAFISTSYPEIDIMDLSILKDESYNFVITDQVLEHVANPWKAMEEMHKKLKPEGIIINTSCSFNPYHTEHDCFRFTVDGFKYIHEAFFDKILLLDYWGNREAIAAFVKDNYKNFDVRTSSEALELATRKEREWQWVVWCIAQKAP